MSILYLILPVSFFFAGIAVSAFVWSTQRGQLDDLETPALRILLEEELLVPKPKVVDKNPLVLESFRES